MKWRGLLITIILRALTCSAQESEINHKPILTREPSSKDIYTGDSVTLTCAIGEDSEGWNYFLYKDTQELPTSDSGSTAGCSYTISSAALSHSGEYRCIAQNRSTGSYSEYSDSLKLNIHARPQAALTLESGWTEIFITESVTMKCEIEGESTEWIYKWYRNGQQFPVDKTVPSKRNGDTYTIFSAEQSHSGKYTCIGENRKKTLFSETSNAFTVKVSALPKPVLTLESGWTEIFTTEKVTLKCTINMDSAEWIYKWYREGQELSLDKAGSSSRNRNRYTIPSAAQSDSGKYTCRGQHRRKSLPSESSDAVTLQVSALPKPVLTLESGWTDIFTTEKVTLKCAIQMDSAEWIYKWYRDGQELPVNKASFSNSNRNRYTISSAAQSDSGKYTCRGQHRRKSLPSESSDAVTLQVSDTKPKPTLTLDLVYGEIYTGDRITLICDAGGHSVGWKYLWYKDTQGAVLLNTDSSRTDGSSYTISSAALSHSGEYWCRARRGKVFYYTDHSDSLHIEIIARPQAALTMESGWTEIFITESVTMRCEIETGSANWSYKWYRNGQQFPVDKTVPSKGNGDTCTILSAAQLHNGQYTCRGESNFNPFYSNNSNSVILKVFETKPRPIMTQELPIGEIYTGDRVTLTCGLVGNSAGWEYLWYEDRQGLVLLNTDSSRTDGSSYTIESATISNSGEYRCQARRGTVPFHSQSSDTLTLNISVEARPQAVLILETVWTEIFTTNYVTIKCEVKDSSLEWNYTWYRDGQEVPQNASDFGRGYAERFTFNSATESQRSNFSCRGKREMKPTYSFESDVLIPKDIIQKWKVIVGFSCTLSLIVFLVVLFLFCMRICKTSGQSTKNQEDMFISMNDQKSQNSGNPIIQNLYKIKDCSLENIYAGNSMEETTSLKFLNKDTSQLTEKNIGILSSFKEQPVKEEMRELSSFIGRKTSNESQSFIQ
nr:PREDICTED: Fc receptor-like protein 5 isoform X1 [Lepisosteus oculatus]